MRILDFDMAIFDLDGVLVDTAKFHYLAWRELADKLGFDFTQHHNEALKGVSRDRSLDILLAVGGLANNFSEEEKQAMATNKNQRYVEYISQLTKADLLPGTKETLIYLKNQGKKIGLGSASKNAMYILEKLGIAHYFDVIVDGNNVKKAKPDPEVFLQGAKMAGISASHCIVFEDAQAGIDAALAAGMKVVAIGCKDILKNAHCYARDLEQWLLD